jgi:hypothetical protein
MADESVARGVRVPAGEPPLFPRPEQRTASRSYSALCGFRKGCGTALPPFSLLLTHSRVRWIMFPFRRAEWAIGLWNEGCLQPHPKTRSELSSRLVPRLSPFSILVNADWFVA